MSRLILFLLICVLCTGLASVSHAVVVDEEPGALMRGDIDDSGEINATDPVYLSNYLYNGGEPPPCMAQADVDDDGYVDITDSVYLLNYLYNGGPPPPGPNGDWCI